MKGDGNYDSLGQVTSGHKYWPDQTPVAGQQFDYNFDTIGNRTSSKAGGDQNGANERPANYGANTLNQYTNRDVPAAFDVVGVALATNTVTVNSQTAYRKGEYFRYQVPVSNGSAAVWQPVAVHETGQTDVTGSVFVPKNQEQFSYDLDGNLTGDGRWSYAWDAENRLINMTSLSSAPTGSKLKLDFLYDSQGRRIQKIVSTNNGSAYYPQSTNRFVYDGWNLIAVLNPQSALVRSFVWGLDLSGSLQGAGGVGGLLEVNDAINGVHFAAYDGNGNVGALVKAVDGTTSAQYECGPFGELIRATGPMAKLNPFRFSTKYQEDETDLLYYGYRYYNASTGRWLSRDPVGERGGLNLYGIVGNRSTQRVDSLGLDDPLLFWPPGTVQAPDPYDDPIPPGLFGNPNGDTYNNALDVYEAWRNGLLPSDNYFGADSRMTRDMMNSPGVRQARDAIRQRIRSVLCGVGKEVSMSQPIRGEWSHPWYKGAWRVLTTWNWTRQFVGSFGGDVTFKGARVNCGLCCTVQGQLSFEVVNTTSRSSYFRHLGWFGIPLPPDVHEGPYANNTQHFVWTEYLLESSCPSLWNPGTIYANAPPTSISVH